MEFAHIIDGLLLIFLAAMLFFAIRLSRQFSEIRADQDRLAELVKNLNIASERAEKAVQSMKKTALETAEVLQGKIGMGQGLSDELDIMIEAGNSLAERLQNIAETSRKSVEAARPKTDMPDITEKKTDKKSTALATPTPVRVTSGGRSRAEKELLAALKNREDKI